MTSQANVVNATDVPTPADRLDVDFLSDEQYEITVRGHRVRVDQPTGSGGADQAPTPTELFVGALPACVAAAWVEGFVKIVLSAGRGRA